MKSGETVFLEGMEVDVRLDANRMKSEGRESLHSMLTRLRCPNCNYLSLDTELLAVEAVCPHCGAHEGWHDWPAGFAWYYFLRVREAFVEDGSNEMTVLQTCVFLEALLELFLVDLIDSRGWPEEIKEVILEAFRGVGQRERLYRKLTGSKLRQDIEHLAINYEHFYGDWEEIRQARNDHMHGRRPQLSYELAEKAFLIVALLSFEVFARLSNKYCLKQ